MHFCLRFSVISTKSLFNLSRRSFVHKTVDMNAHSRFKASSSKLFLNHLFHILLLQSYLLAVVL